MTPYTIVRNEIPKTLNIFKGTRDTWKDVEYQAPQISAETINDDIQWLGLDNVVNYLNTILKRAGQDYWKDAIPEDGENAGIFNPDKFKLDVTNLAASGLKISELVELIDNEVKAQQDYIAGEAMQIFMNGTQEEKLAVKEIIENRTSKINGLRAQKEARSTRRSKEAALETASPA